MAWEENSCICLHMQLIAILSRIGVYISDRLRLFVENDLGHWEKHEYYCYKCGKLMSSSKDHFHCDDCGTEYKHQ